MASNIGDGGNSVLNSSFSCFNTCLAFGGSATEDQPMRVNFYKLFPASAITFKMGLIIFIVEMSRELKVVVKKPGFMMAEIPWAAIWNVACHKAVILQRWLKCHHTRVERAESFTSFFSGCGSKENTRRLVPALTLIATTYLLQTDVPLEISARDTPRSAGSWPESKTALRSPLLSTLIIAFLASTDR